MSRASSLKKSKVLIISFSVLTAVIFVALLAVKIELTKAIDKNAELKQDLHELAGENVRLRLEYESLIDLPELEEYAKTEMGMQKPGYTLEAEIHVEKHDKAIIIKDSEKAEADKLVSSIKEYFRQVKCKFN